MQGFVKSAVTVFLESFVMTSAMALENSVKPEVIEPLAVSPKVSHLIGNSYSFYNCGVHT